MVLVAIVLGCLGCPPTVVVAKPLAAVMKAPQVKVVEPGGLARKHWPLSAGVPFPKGYLRDVADIGLADAGKALPVQSRVLSRWPDGSVRWAMLDWSADLGAGQAHTWSVERRPGVAAAVGISIKEDAERITVDSGALRFDVLKRGAGLVGELRRNGDSAPWGPLTSFVEVGGQRYAAQAPSKVTILERGPLRARIELRGSYGGGLQYVVRIDAFAGQPALRILHSFEQHADQAVTRVDRISLELAGHLADDAAFSAERVGAPPSAGKLPSSGVALYQEDNRTLHVGTEKQEGRASGWFDVHDAKHGVVLTSRYFWQEYPQSVSLRRDGWSLNLWAPEAPPAQVGMGAAKTHELTILLHGPERPDAKLGVADLPLLAHVDAEWTARSGALRGSIAPGPGHDAFLREEAAAYERYRLHADKEEWDDRGAPQCPAATDGAATPRPDPLEHRRSGFYGMFNWGDWNYPGYHDDTKGCDAWGNLEYDMTHVLALGYAATGSTQQLDGVIAAARHFMDVDRIYFQTEHPNWVGMNHPKNPLHFSFALGGVDLGHTWTEGLLSYFYLTGDERGLTAARDIGDYLVNRLKATLVKGNPRQWGWPQIALVAVYEATGDERYKTAALEYARRGMAQHAPDKFKDFKIGILAEALAYTHSISSDRQLSDWLTRYSAAVVAYPGTPDPRLLPAVAYVGRMANKPQLTRIAVQAVPALKFGNWGKPFTIAGRLGFGILATAQ